VSEISLKKTQNAKKLSSTLFIVAFVTALAFGILYLVFEFYWPQISSYDNNLQYNLRIISQLSYGGILLSFILSGIFALINLRKLFGFGIILSQIVYLVFWMLDLEMRIYYDIILNNNVFNPALIIHCIYVALLFILTAFIAIYFRNESIKRRKVTFILTIIAFVIIFGYHIWMFINKLYAVASGSIEEILFVYTFPILELVVIMFMVSLFRYKRKNNLFRTLQIKKRFNSFKDKTAQQIKKINLTKTMDAVTVGVGVVETAIDSAKKKQTHNQNKNQTHNQTTEQAQQKHKDEYVPTSNLVLFSIITLGIYALMWVYKITDKYKEPEKSSGLTLLAFILVPFYFIYWFYTYSSKIDEASKRIGYAEDSIAVISTVLPIIALSLISMVIMQSKINRRLEKENCDIDSTINSLNTNALPEDMAKESEISVERKLKNFKDLLDEGLITEEYYEKKVDGILNKNGSGAKNQ